MPRRPARRRWPWLVFGLPLAAMLAAVLLLTDAAPAAGGDEGQEIEPPSAWQAAAAQAVLRQLHAAAASGGPGEVEASAAELAAVAAVASSGLRPDRVALGVDGFGFHAMASHRLPLGRWLNVALDAGSSEDGRVPLTVTVGSVTLPPALARLALAGAARVLRARGFAVPDPETAVRWLRADDQRVAAGIDFAGSGELARAAADAWQGQGTGVAAAYCRLARQQRARPTDQFSELVRRAFAPPAQDDVAQSNRDALVALAMLVVDPRVGMLAGVGPGQPPGCEADGRAATIHGRNDSPKHWLMSAALAATTGAQLSQAAGEWKELADSEARQREFRPGDASGFSFVDIAADRAGELIALAAVDPARASAVRAGLARADDDALMPRELLRLGDGISAGQFARDYGSVDDPRYRQVRSRIDAAIRARTPTGN